MANERSLASSGHYMVDAVFLVHKIGGGHTNGHTLRFLISIHSASRVGWSAGEVIVIRNTSNGAEHDILIGVEPILRFAMSIKIMTPTTNTASEVRSARDRKRPVPEA
jgi:hypothetical protein